MGLFGYMPLGWHSPIYQLVLFLFLTSPAPSSLVWGQHVEPYRRENFNVLFEGQNAIFYCDPSGWDHDSLTYQWTLNDTHIIATGRTFHVNNVHKSDSGLYKCIVRGKIDNKEIVAEQSTFAYVKKGECTDWSGRCSPETMLTQMVDEGVSVTILCNVSNSNIPPGASNMRYQWHNPNGTLIGNQWYLRLAKIKTYESGVYVCTVSVDVDGTTHEASRGTNIQVKRAGSVVFPGLSGHTMDVTETSPVYQTCRVLKDHGGANYVYHWLGPDGEQISDNNQLRIDYALRSKHSGAYTCVATTRDNTQRDLEGTIYVIVSPLRFQINTLAEDLRLGGFTHRRVSVSQLPLPTGTTREQFEYMWMTPDGRPATSQPSPEMYIQLRSPQQFGLYTVRVRGLNSGYKHELQSDVLIQYPPPNGYSLRISGQAGPITPNSRVEVLCELQPTQPAGAKIRWLNAQNMPVAPDGRLIIERFNIVNEGSYVCEAALPDGLILRQLLSLQLGNGTISGGGEGVSPYTIYIVRYPTYFSYGDEVRLQCLVRPDPTDVIYEWKKDGQFIGSEQIFRIPAYSPSDAGKYRCRATIRGIAGYAEEILTSPTDDTRELVMNPSLVNTSVFKPFHIECVSHRLGARPAVVFSSGANITLDGQFQIQYPDTQKVVISVPMGLSAVYNGMSIQCILPNGYSKETRIFIYDPCPAGQVRCLSGECVSGDKICNGISDCRDGSDESGQFCSAKLVAIPVKQEVRPLERFQVTCRSTSPRQIPSARIPMTGIFVEQDQRFVVTRPRPEEMVIVAPHGLPQHNQAILIECFFPNEGTRTALVTLNATEVIQPCPEGFLCRDGTCLSPWQRCDGHFNCLDGSDEANCPPPAVACRPDEFRCLNGQCVPTSSRCDGRLECLDGSDEAGCPPPIVTCRPGEFRCSNGQCVQGAQRCDGRYDCSDGSDEANCPSIERPCRPDEFRCSNGQCVPTSSRCDGRYDCSDGSDESGCKGVTIEPDRIVRRPWEPFSFTCTAPTGKRPLVVVGGTNMRLEELPGFSVNRPSTNTIRITANRGLREIFGNMTFECYFERGDRRSINVFILHTCPTGMYSCRDGTCFPGYQLCNGVSDCRDGSDEDSEYCAKYAPPSAVQNITIPPRRPFEFTCSAPEDSRPVIIIPSLDNLNIENDMRFVVTRPLPNTMRVRAIYGLTEADNGISFMCLLEPDTRQYITVTVESNCAPGQNQCGDGDCLPISRFCDGRTDCADSSDENRVLCPPKISEELVITPERIRKRPWEPFSFICRAPMGQRPLFVKDTDRSSLAQDQRFIVTTIRESEIMANASYGLPGTTSLRVWCTLESGVEKAVNIVIEQTCPVNTYECADGICIQTPLVCNGKRDCRDGSDERFCEVIRPGLTITPGSISVRPRQPFSFTCTAAEASRPEVYLSRNLTSVSTDPRFKMDRLSYNIVEVTAPYGLLEIHDGMVFTCVTPTGEKSQVSVSIDHPCGRGRVRCASGACISSTSVCDGQKNCPDSSDEDPHFCTAEPSGVIVSPPSINVQAWSPFNFSCAVTRGSDPLVIYSATGMSVDGDPKFRVHRPNAQTILIHAPYGIHAHTDAVRFVCIDSEGGRGEIVVSVESNCGPGESQCRSGECVRTSQFCDGFANCKDSSDEFPTLCQKPLRGVVTMPNTIETPPWREFLFICAGPSSSKADLVFQDNRKLVAEDPRFEMIRINKNIIQVTAPYGLRGIDDTIIECFLPTGEKDLVKITVKDPCPYGQSQCKDGRCVNTSEFCNGQRGCSDGSDEDPKFCPAITPAPEFAVYPDSIVTSPWKHFAFVCIAPPGSQATIVFQKDGRQIEGDPRFDVFRRNGEAIEVSAPFGLRQIDSMAIDPKAVVIQVTARRGLPKGDAMVLACVTRLGDRRTVTITVKDPCPSGQMSCADAACIDRDRFCDGRPDCADGSDEQNEFCPSRVEDVDITPEIIDVPEWRPFSFLCRGPPNSRVTPIFTQTSLPVANDSRFDVTGLNTENVQVIAIQGLRSTDDTEITCVTDRGLKKAITITISTYCGLGETGCRDGTCIAISNLCDGRYQCPDRSDETREFCGEIEIIPPECRLNEFRCNDGTCIPHSHTCDGIRHCNDGSDESSAVCGMPELPITITPRSISVYEWTPFKLVCNSNTGRITAYFKANGDLVEFDHRFHVAHVNSTALEVSAPFGLRNIDDMEIECVSTSGDRNSIQITINSQCPPGKSQCKDGDCIPTVQICDFVTHCKDHTDEIPDFCRGIPRPPVIADPPLVDMPPWQMFEFACTTTDGSQLEAYFSPDGRKVRDDPRFLVTRHNASTIVISAPRGLRDVDDMRIDCVSTSGINREVLITIHDFCGPEQSQCKDGSCIPLLQLCDRISQCTDHSDEDPGFCRLPDKPPIYAEPPNIYKPAWVPFEFVCGTYNRGQISVVFAMEGSRVDLDPRFRVSKLNDSTVVVSAPRGLRDIDDTIIQCVGPIGQTKNVSIIISSSCGVGYTQCADGKCIEEEKMCDGVSQCSDRSDEDAEFCREPIRPTPPPPVIVSPSTIDVPPYRPFDFTCISTDGSRIEAVFKVNRSPVNRDPRFHINRYNSSVLTVSAIYGLRDIDDVQIECVTLTGQKGDATITILDNCAREYTMCKNGACIPVKQLCDGVAQCQDGSDEDTRYCREPTRPPPPPVQVSPPRIDIQPWRSFDFMCMSRPNTQMTAFFEDGSPVEGDPRFRLIRFNTSAILVSAPYGLRGSDDMRIECVTTAGDKGEFVININDTCGLGYTRCRDGACIPEHQLCDGTSQCRDNSDEDSRFCRKPIRPPSRPDIIITPPNISIPAWRPFEFTCVSSDGSRIDAVLKKDGSPVDGDPRFRVNRYNVSALYVSATDGLRDIDDLIIECVSETGQRGEIAITIPDSCGPGLTKCKNGQCIKTSQFCDGASNCRDGSDEDPRFCKVSTPRPPISGLIVYPPIIDVPAWRPFEFTCISLDGGRISAVFKTNGSSVEADRRFKVIRFNTSAIQLSAPYGLLDIHDIQIECISDIGPRRDISITIRDDCDRGYTKCKDGSCIHVSQLCDGTPQCRDGSDEDLPFCEVQTRPPTPPVIVYPPIIDVPAWERFEISCYSPEGMRIDAVFRDNGSSVEADQRFRVTRYNDSYIRIDAPDGLPDHADTQIECVDAGGRIGNVLVTIADECGRGYTKCKDRQCIPLSQWCDGVPHCRDKSDENLRFCTGPTLPPSSPIIASPHIIEVPAWQSFNFTCFSSERLRLVAVFKVGGSLVEKDPRFRVTRYNVSYIQVTAPEGLPDSEDIKIECVDEMDRALDVSITIADECGRSYTKCRDGQCIPKSQWCDGIPHCRDRSDEDHRFCREPEGPPLGPVIAIPSIINVPAWERFEFTCFSSDGSRVSAVFKNDGSPVDVDSRFQVTRYNTSTLQIRAPEGLPDFADIEIECSAESGRRKEVSITILEECGRGYTRCKDGQCIREPQWCDGAVHCADGSDEDPRFCPGPTRPSVPSVIVTPTRIDVSAWQPFNFTCTSTDGSRLRAVLSSDGSSVDSDPRFRLTAYNASALVVTAVYGIRDIDDMQIECVSLTGGVGNITINVSNECGRGYSKCKNAACIPVSQLCDGIDQCRDKSDEDPRFCREPVRLEVTPPRIRSPPWTPFRFTCTASLGERPSVILLRNRKPIELDPHFTVRRPEDNVIEVFAPQGLATFPADDQIACVTITGQQKEVPITISNPCRYGQLPCKDGTCVSEVDFCNGRNDCPDGSDESTIACPDMPSGVRVTPEKINTPPWREFTFKCTDIMGRGLPTAIISDSRKFVSSDTRFRIVEINSSSIGITATHGLRGSEDSMSIDCISRRGDSATVVITVEDSCGPGQLQCRDGRCLPSSRFCDGRRDCSDGSDEDMPHCKRDALIITPSYLRNPPWILFSFVCIAPIGQRPNVVFAVSRRPVEQDPRFTINRSNSTTIEVTAPQGLRGDEEVLHLECFTDAGLRENVTIFIDDMCKPNAMQCRDGRCRPIGDFCDGKSDCADESDEIRQFCEVARPPKLVLTSQRVVIRPWQQFRTICISTTGSQPSFVFRRDQSLVENDQRYLVNRINATAIELLAPRGLRGQQDVDRIDCLNTIGDRVAFEITIESPCGPDQMACQDGLCLPTSQFCDNRFDCYDKSDEIHDFCPARRPSVIATPESITTDTWQLIRFYCISPEGHPLTVMFSANRQLVKEDQRYHIRLVNSTTMEVVVPRGLRGPEDSTQIDCMITSGERKRVTITVRDKCGSGRLPCRDGTCLPGVVFCDGKRDCSDGSDEYNEYCARPTPPPPTLPNSVRLSPTRQRVRPGQEIRLECNALSSDVRDNPIVEFANGTSVTSDPNFRVSYPQLGRVVVIIPRGTELPWRHLEFHCYLPGGDKSRAEVFIDQACDIGQRRCDNGQCIYLGQFCDGKIDCADGSDELPHNCDACDPISQPCGKFNERDPKIPYFQEHWRCDGEDDCGNGFDEQNCEAYSRVPGMSCGRAQFECRGGGLIPSAYHCDGQPDCPNGDDEYNCRRPSIYAENFTSRHEVRRGQNLVIECDVVGVPPPAIVWRYNWGCLPQGDRAIIEPVLSPFGCGGARSRLTIKNVQEGDDGIYNCEGLTGTDRALSQDIFVILID